MNNNHNQNQKYLLDTTRYLLKDKKIGILALNIKEVNNTKDDYTKALKEFGSGVNSWKNKEPVNNDEIKLLIYQGIVGFIIKTGIKNNIVCIDWDYKQRIIDIYNAVEHRIKSGEIIPDSDNDKKIYNNHIKSLSIKDELLKQSILYAKTPSGGYHFIVEYEEDIYVKNNTGLLGNIDIRTEGGCIFFGIRNDGKYEYIKGDIKKTPKKIIRILQPLMREKEKCELLKNVPDDIDDKYNNICNDTRCLYKYDIKDSIFKCYIELLLDAEPDYLDDWKDWFIFTIICKKLEFKDLWDCFSSQSNKYDRKNNRKFWNFINVNEYDVDINYIVSLLKSKYKIKVPKIQIIYYPYNPITSYEGLDIENINTKYLDADIYKTNNHIMVINSGVCTAKTTSLFNYAINNKFPIISIVHLKNLGSNQQDNFNRKCKDKYKGNIADYERYKMIMYDDKKDLKNLTRTNSILTTINNLSKILKKAYENSINYRNPYDPDIKWNVIDNINKYVIFLDEGGRQIHNLHHSPTLGNVRIETIEVLKNIIENSKKVIASDGTIDDLTIDYFNQFKHKPKYYINSHKSYDNPFRFYHSMGLSCHGVFENAMIQLLDAKKWFMITCNTKVDAVYYKTFLLNTKKILLEDIVFYTADDGNNVVKNATEEWRNKVIIFSPSIVEGVDFVPEEPIEVFSIIQGCNTINAEQIKQQICRARKISIVHICVFRLENRLYYNNANEIHTALMSNVNTFKKNMFYNELNNKLKETDILIEFNNLKIDKFDANTNKLLKEPTDDCRRYAMSLHIDTTNKQNIQYTLRNILENIGMYEEDNIEFIKKNAIMDKKKPNDNDNNEAVGMYVYQVLPKIEETDEYKVFEEKKIVSSKQLHLYDYINNKPDTDDNIKYRKYLEGSNYPEPTEEEIGILRILGVDKRFLKELLYNNKRLLTALSNTYNDQSNAIIFNLMLIICNDSSNHYKNYKGLKYFIMDDHTLNNTINKFSNNEHYVNVSVSIPYKVQQYKYLMNKYAEDVDWFSFEYETADLYIQEDINVSVEDFDRFKSMRLYSKKSLDTIRTRKDFLNNMMLVILSDIFGYTNIKKERKNMRVRDIVITNIKYSIKNYVRNTILLYHIGRRLKYNVEYNNINDDTKASIKYIEIDDDIVKYYLEDVQPYYQTDLYKWYKEKYEDVKYMWESEEEED